MFGPEHREYERIVLWIDKQFLEGFTLSGEVFTACFDTDNPNHVNLLRPEGVNRQFLTFLLEQLISDMTDFVRNKVTENNIVAAEDVEETTRKIAMGALKYGDLSNQPTKDYNFDMERFAAFEGNTGPYILYTIVRVKSILSRYGAWENLPIQPAVNAEGKDLMLALTKFGPTMEAALKAASPNMICAYIYELAGCVNKFYHETPILKEENEELKAGHIALIGLAKNILETCISILGFSAPDKM